MLHTSPVKTTAVIVIIAVRWTSLNPMSRNIAKTTNVSFGWYLMWSRRRWWWCLHIIVILVSLLHSTLKDTTSTTIADVIVVGGHLMLLPIPYPLHLSSMHPTIETIVVMIVAVVVTAHIWMTLIIIYIILGSTILIT